MRCSFLVAALCAGVVCNTSLAVDPELTLVNPPAGFATITLSGCSADGNVAGANLLPPTSSSDSTPGAAYRVAPGVASVVLFAPLPAGYSQARVTCVAANGAYFGGFCSQNSTQRVYPFIYGPNGWNILTGTGTASTVRGISSDGQVVFGSTNATGTQRAAFWALNGLGGVISQTTSDGRAMTYSFIHGGEFIAAGAYRFWGTAGLPGSGDSFVEWLLAPPFISTVEVPNPSPVQNAAYAVVSRDMLNLGANVSNGATNFRAAVSPTASTAWTKVDLGWDVDTYSVDAVSDGEPILGLTMNTAAGFRAAVWRGGTTRVLSDLLVDQGVTMPAGVQLRSVSGGSADGTRYVGIALTPTAIVGYFATVNPPTPTVDCAADFNKDGFITFEDFDAFVAAFEAGC